MEYPLSWPSRSCLDLKHKEHNISVPKDVDGQVFDIELRHTKVEETEEL